MTIHTTGELIRALAMFPDDTPLANDDYAPEFGLKDPFLSDQLCIQYDHSSYIAFNDSCTHESTRRLPQKCCILEVDITGPKKSFS